MHHLLFNLYSKHLTAILFLIDHVVDNFNSYVYFTCRTICVVVHNTSLFLLHMVLDILDLYCQSLVLNFDRIVYVERIWW